MGIRFRLRGSAIQIVRVEDSTGADRVHEVALGSFSIAPLKVADSLLAQLSADERAQFDAYVVARGAAPALRARLAALELQQTIAEATRHVAGVQDPEEKAVLAAILRESIVMLRSSLQRMAKGQ
jgi:hypothetical protein